MSLLIKTTCNPRLCGTSNKTNNISTWLHTPTEHLVPELVPSGLL